MPIKFRCVHCNKLLGIARRKAGTIVDCPGCRQQLIVPTPEEPEPEPESDQVTLHPEPPSHSPPNKLFEQDNFDLMLNEQDALTYRNREDEPAKAPVPQYVPPTFAIERQLPVPPTAMPSMNPVAAPMPYPVQAPPSGIILTGSKIMLLLVLMFFLLAAAFGAGVFVGKSLISSGG